MKILQRLATSTAFTLIAGAVCFGQQYTQTNWLLTRQETLRKPTLS